jgi:hypothetical protein
MDVHLEAGQEARFLSSPPMKLLNAMQNDVQTGSSARRSLVDPSSIPPACTSPPTQWQHRLARETKVGTCNPTIERSFMWLRRDRRMSTDDYAAPATSETGVNLSMLRVILNRMAHEPIQPCFRYRRVA